MERLCWKTERWETLKGMRQCVERKYHSPHGEFIVHLRDKGFDDHIALEDWCWDAADKGMSKGFPVGMTKELWERLPFKQQ